MVDLKNIVVGEKLFVGIPETNDEYSDFSPMGSGIKNESSQKQRIKNNYKNNQIELDNVPYSGFEIIGHSLGGKYTNDSIILQDQRGMKILVDITYFIEMIEYCTIVNGIIINDCIWGNLNSKKILIPVNSDLYQQVVENTKRKSVRISIKELQFGDYCKLHDGREIIYIGYYAVYEDSWGKSYNLKTLNKKKKHVFIDKNGKYSYDIYNVVTKIDVSEIVERNSIKTEKTKLEYINDLFNENNLSYVFVPKVTTYESFYEILENYNITEEDANNYKLFIDKDKNISKINHVNSGGMWNRVYEYSWNNKRSKDVNQLVNHFDLKMLSYYINVVDPEDNKTKTFCIDRR